MEKVSGHPKDISQRLFDTFHEQVVARSANRKAGKRPGSKDLEAIGEKALHGLYEAAHQERIVHRLGIIGRARVAFGVQQRLLAAGYPPTVVKQVLFAMLASVSSDTRPR